MNYITIINNFWRFYDDNKDKLNASDIVLYKVLLRYCNKVGWINPFSVNPYLMNEINPLSTNTYYKSLQRLHDLSLINYKKGKNNVSNSTITILKIKNSVNNSIDNSIKFSVVNSPVNSVVNSVVNNNKTIKQLNNKTIRQLDNNDFQEIINNENFKKYLKKNNLEIKEINKEINNKFNFKKELENLKIEKNIINDFLIIRKKKKAHNSETAFKKIEKEIKLSGKSANECIKIAVERSWAGFTAEWLQNSQSSLKTPKIAEKTKPPGKGYKPITEDAHW